MKRIMVCAAVIFIVIFGVLLFFDGEQTEDAKKQETTYIGFLLNGSKDDSGYSQAHYEGIMTLEQEMNVEVICEENVPTDDTCKEIMQQMIDDGCKIIFCNSVEFGTYEKELADANPDIYFFHATGTESGENFTSYFGRIYQMRYLSGIVAGMQTESNSIGYVAAMAIPEVVRGINAFTLGVQSVNPEAVVHVEWTDSWVDELLAEEATYRLIDEYDIDVLTCHVNPTRPLEVAEKENVYCIGYNMDNSSKYPNTFLTACVWHWDIFYKEQVTACLEGKFKGGHYWEGIETGIIDLAPFTDNVKPGISEKVQAARESLTEGSVDVFYGPIYDQRGVLRVRTGESMSDDEMINEFDWFVKGVAQ